MSTSLVHPRNIAPGSPSTLARRSSQKTLKSIKKYLPHHPVSTKKEHKNRNPITLHSVNDDLFPRLWSFLAEVMVVTGDLAPSTKEAIALKVNNASKSTLGRRMPCRTKSTPNNKTSAAQEHQLREQQVLQYADTLLQKGDESLYPLLNKAAKAETALVVLLFRHLNRSSTAIMGQQRKSTAMMSVSFRSERRNSAPANSGGMRSVVSRMMAPMTTCSSKAVKPGITSPLFHNSISSLLFNSNTTTGSSSPNGNDNCLPANLQNARHAGDECANALGRLVAWVEVYHSKLQKNGVLSPDMLMVLQQSVPPSDLRSHHIAQWISTDGPVRQAIYSLPSGTSQDLVKVLLLVSYSPESIPNSIWWVALCKSMGKDAATTVVLWWSLKLSLEEARGLGGDSTSTSAITTSGSNPEDKARMDDSPTAAKSPGPDYDLSADC